MFGIAGTSQGAPDRQQVDDWAEEPQQTIEDDAQRNNLNRTISVRGSGGQEPTINFVIDASSRGERDDTTDVKDRDVHEQGTELGRVIGEDDADPFPRVEVPGFGAFQARMAAAYESEREVEATNRSRVAWLRLGALDNPRAAWDIELIAEAVEESTLTSRPGLHAERLRDPIEFLSACRSQVHIEWEAFVEKTMDHLRHGDVIALPNANLRRGRLERAIGRLDDRIRDLRKHLEGSTFTSVVRGTGSADCHGALRSADHILTQLFTIDEAFDGMRAPIETFEDHPGLRRRRVAEAVNAAFTPDVPTPPDTSSVVSSRADDTLVRAGDADSRRPSSAAASLVWLLPIAHINLSACGTRIPIYIHRSVKAFMKPTQAELYSLAILFSLVSGIFMGIGIMQERQPACIPDRNSRDDDFWSLMSQLMLQVLSLYCTLIPLVRDRAVSLRRGWFHLSLSVSMLAAIAALATYGVSWRASKTASFASGFASLMASVQLAGGVRQYQQQSTLNT